MDSWEQALISESDFTDAWGAYTKNDGNLFSYEDVKDLSRNHIWSVMDCGGEKPDHWIAAPGFHIVNVLGYVITNKPWDDETPDAFYFYDDFDMDD